MDYQVVSVDDLKEYDNQIKALSSNGTVKIGTDSIKNTIKITVVNALPTSPDANTIYIIR